MYALIDSPFAMFGLERGLQLLWLLCSLVAHIFHDCAGYRTANYTCSPLSAAVAMTSLFFFSLFVLTWSLLTFFFSSSFGVPRELLTYDLAEYAAPWLNELLSIICLLCECIKS